MPSNLGVIQQLATPSSMVAGTATLAAADTAQRLVAATPCKCVWLGPFLTNDGAVSNVNTIFVGDASNQVICLIPTDAQGVLIVIDDVSKIYWRSHTDTDELNYIIFS